MSKAEELAMKPRWFDTYQGPQQGYTVEQFRALDASHQRLKEALERLVDNVDGGEFVSLTRIADARAALEQAKDL